MYLVYVRRILTCFIIIQRMHVCAVGPTLGAKQIVIARATPFVSCNSFFNKFYFII